MDRFIIVRKCSCGEFLDKVDFRIIKNGCKKCDWNYRRSMVPSRSENPVFVTEKIESNDYDNPDEYVCPHCEGRFLEYESLFCSQCGSELNWDHFPKYE